MMRHWHLSLAAALVLLLLAAAASDAAAARDQSDWPCVQREVPQISAGMVWTGGAIDANDQSWSSNEKVAPKVAEVTSRRKTVEEAIGSIDQFAAGLKEDRGPVLTALFTGVLQTINNERRKIMAGIKRYARKQSAVADRIKQRSIERAALSQKESPTEEDKRRLAALDEQLAWDTRVYDERRQSLSYVCETPVLLEQRLFQIGRHVSELVGKN
jgi:hypothetical protein